MKLEEEIYMECFEGYKEISLAEKEGARINE